MASDYSDNEDDDRRHRSRKKNKQHSRSRSDSRDNYVDKSKKSKKSKKSSNRRSRSDSRSSDKRKRRRSRSRSSEYSSKSSRHRDHRRSRSRSHSRSRSDHDSRRSSRSRDSHVSHGSRATADNGKEKKTDRTNAKLAEKKLQKALKAAVTADDILRAQGVSDEDAIRAKTSQLTFEEQKKRASAINDIESGEFVQEEFKSSRSEIPMPTGSAIDASHTGAMFSSGPTKTQASGTLSASCSLPSYSDSLMHPNLYIGVEEKMERWKQKVIELRKQRLAQDVAI